MKMKWKIVLILNFLLVIIIVITDIFFHKTVTSLLENEINEELENYSVLGTSLLDARSPGDWSVDGESLYKGDLLMNDNFGVVDEISEKTGILATIFLGDTRISTTVKDKDGKRLVGTQASDEVIETVLKNNGDYKGTAVVVGTSANTYYTPLHDKDGAIVGMWFVGIYTDVIETKISNAMLSITSILILLLVLGSTIAYFIGCSISDGFVTIRNDLEQMENGNFNISFTSKKQTRKDEIGNITRSFLHMQENIRDIISSIKKETTSIENTSCILADGADNVYSAIEEISATTQQLSAGMEETAASSQEMNATSIAIEEQIGHVASKASNGQVISSEIKGRAENLMKVALESQKTAIELYDKANKKLRQSIEKTSAIEEIKALSKTILTITAQTNLLALNASIESARAGEAGKGFAVVANEIGILARNSKNAVSQIEEISNEISNVVEDMVFDSKLLLNFVDTKVIKDYGVLVQTGEQYLNDADTIEQMVMEIKNSTSQLSESIIYIRQAIDEVTLATEEGSKGAADIAEKSNSIFHKTNQVLAQANTNKEIASTLNEQIRFFKI